jgi:hypothetical protein
MQNQNQQPLAFNNTKEINDPMKKSQQYRKVQEDRLLKHLSRRERRQQEIMRRLIKVDPIFQTA